LKGKVGRLLGKQVEENIILSLGGGGKRGRSPHRYSGEIKKQEFTKRLRKTRETVAKRNQDTKKSSPIEQGRKRPGTNRNTRTVHNRQKRILYEKIQTRKKKKESCIIFFGPVSPEGKGVSPGDAKKNLEGGASSPVETCCKMVSGGKEGPSKKSEEPKTAKTPRIASPRVKNWNTKRTKDKPGFNSTRGGDSAAYFNKGNVKKEMGPGLQEKMFFGAVCCGKKRGWALGGGWEALCTSFEVKKETGEAAIGLLPTDKESWTCKKGKKGDGKRHRILE